MESALKVFEIQPSTQCGPTKSNLVRAFALPSHAQLNSTFLQKLPYEIRVLIYRQVILDIGSSVLHIYVPQIGPEPCVYLNPRCLEAKAWTGSVHESSWGYAYMICRAPSEINSEAIPGLAVVFALASSCRHLYHELMPIFYASITIHLIHLDSAQYFLFPTMHRLQMLRTINISWIIFGSLSTSKKHDAFGDRAFATDEQSLNKVCATLSTLPALQELKMMFFHSSCPISETALLTPLIQITNLRSFQVQLSWNAEDALEPMDGPFPFQISRKPVPLDGDPDIEEALINGRTRSERRGTKHLSWRVICVGPSAIYIAGRAVVRIVRKWRLKAG